jgi:hypothetical protein
LRGEVPSLGVTASIARNGTVAPVVSRTGRDFGYGDGRSIELPCAIAGYYRAPAGMSATDALLTWKRGGLLYFVAIREGRVAR